MIIAYCGLICSDCDALRATVGNDTKAVEEMAKQASEQLGRNVNPEEVLCYGCTSDEKRSGYCAICKIRACAIGRKLVNCAYCSDYPCDILKEFLTKAHGAEETLEEIRSNF